MLICEVEFVNCDMLTSQECTIHVVISCYVSVNNVFLKKHELALAQVSTGLATFMQNNHTHLQCLEVFCRHIISLCMCVDDEHQVTCETHASQHVWREENKKCIYSAIRLDGISLVMLP